MNNLKFRTLYNKQWYYFTVEDLKNMSYYSTNNHLASIPLATAFIKAPFLSQFTGLYDKNGKEIYEGDIIKWHDNYIPGKHDGISEIVWRFTGFDIKASSFGYEGENIISWDDLQVIGNIYETKTLEQDHE
jgi:uncharacterized phage protein (TIGR01671 family)